jgi:hypothetical protein
MAKKLYKVKTDKDEFLEARPRNNVEANYSQGITINQKQHRVFWPFLILSIIIIWLGVRFLYSNITDPLANNVPDWILEQIDDTSEDSIEDLKNKDTDQDGLNNYQEIYQYHTSMFLPDTDSDGFNDYEEVTSGNDPLCPVGQNCSLLRFITPTTKISDIIQDVVVDPDLTVQQAAANEFRQFLLENGMTQEEVDELTDEDLMVLFQTVYESGIILTDDSFLDSTPEEIRTFLLSQPGSDETEINNLTDDELLQIRDQFSLGE